MNDVAPVQHPEPPASVAACARRYDRVALVLQGGGALGAYQAGVLEALCTAGIEPNWISGVSIGAINSAIIAGNPLERRVERLRAFWDTVSGRDPWLQTPDGDGFRQLRNMMSALMAVALGQPGFFKPRLLNPWFLPEGTDGATSYYDTSELRQTLLRLVDFDLLNDRKKRFSVGAVNVRTGNFIYFDTQNCRIGPEHIMASGALPPALPAVEIDGEFYWDGGIVSNTPLQYLLDQKEDRSALVFQVDLFSARGDLPRSMPEVLTRQKDITYSSRTRQNTDQFRRIHALKMQLLDALKRIPDDKLTEADREIIKDYSDAGVVDIVHLIYQQKHYETDAKDYEFSTLSMREHWASGKSDTERTLRHPEWFRPPNAAKGVAVHDVHREDPGSAPKRKARVNVETR